MKEVTFHPPNFKSFREIMICIFYILSAPIHMYIEYFRITFVNLQLKEFPNNSLLIKTKEKLKRRLNNAIKLELGLETIYQIIGQLVLLFLAKTETPTQNGLKTIFNEDLGGLALFALIASITLSFYSCVSSHWKALNACREHFPIMSRMTSGFCCLCACVSRVMAIVLFISVPLGLFSFLRHLQGEQYPWHVYVLDFVSPDGMMVLGDNEHFEWASVDRWKKNGTLYLTYENGSVIRDARGDVTPNPNHLVSPPDYTLYAGMSLKYYLITFFVQLGIHVIVVFMAKYILSEAFRNGFNFFGKILHCLENTNIPYNSKEWDDELGNAEEHKKRMCSNWKEGFVVIIIKAIFNASLLSPLFYLGNSRIFHKSKYYKT